MSGLNGNAWGIDFGTTNSTLFGYIGQYGGGNPVPSAFGEARRPIPSVVTIDREDGAVFVGRDAKIRYVNNPARYAYVHSIKTILDDDDWRLSVAGKVWRAVDIAAEIFKLLKMQAVRQSYMVKDLVVAIPNGASGKKRERIAKAAELAGLRVRQFVTEPIAAFFANYNTLKDVRYVVVFDWGGGTLDVTVLENRSDRKIVELGKGGLQMAGDDLDLLIARDIHRRLRESGRIAKTYEEVSDVAREQLVMECERAKCELSEKQESTITVADYDGVTFIERLTREMMSRIIHQPVRRAAELLSKVIAESRLTVDDIGNVLVVGGSSKLLDVKEAIDRMFSRQGGRVLKPKEAEWNVAKGACRLDYRAGVYYSAEDIGVILGDEEGSFFSLLNGYFSTAPDPLRRFNRSYGFGIMDTTRYPRIVFAARDIDGNLRPLDLKVAARAYGFLTEKIILDATVTESLVFAVKIKSDHTAEGNAVFWEYADMRLVYEAPSFGE